MSATPTSPITPDDQLIMPGGDQFERIDGHLAERAMGSSWDGFVAGQLFALIVHHKFGKTLGLLFNSDVGYQ